MNNRRTHLASLSLNLGLTGILAVATLALSACGGGSNIAEPTPLVELPAPAYRMERIWSTDAGEGAGPYVSGFRPAVSGDRVYVANRDGYVEALSLDDGRRIWRSRTGDSLVSGPSIAGDKLLLGSRDGRIVALDLASGKRAWTTELSSEVISAPTGNAQTAVARTLDGRLVAMDLATGDRRWTIERTVPTLTLRGASSPVIDGSTVYAGLDSGKVIALDLATGEQRWEQVVALPTGRSELERIVDVDANPLIVDNELYAASVGDKVASLSLTSGRVRWQHDASVERDLGYDDDHIFAADMDGDVLALNRITGARSWQQEALKYRKTTGPTVFEGDIVVGDFEGYVHWLSADDGSIITRGQPFGEAIRSRPVVAGDRVIVLGADGEVAALRFVPTRAE